MVLHRGGGTGGGVAAAAIGVVQNLPWMSNQKRPASGTATEAASLACRESGGVE